MGSTPLASVLFAPGPAAGLEDRLMLFGQFVGSWDVVVTDREPDGAETVAEGEWHFGWVLGGLAVQDVWIVPHGRVAGTDRGSVEHGTAVRVYDPDADRWIVSWSGPRKRRFYRLEARPEGEGIVLRGAHDGVALRWSFSDIHPDRFHWRNEQSHDGGDTWTLVQWMDVTRRRSADLA
jgi:hypothetical protein